MAELADALASGASEGNFVQVRLLLSAPQRMIFSMEEIILFCFSFLLQILNMIYCYKKEKKGTAFDEL